MSTSAELRTDDFYDDQAPTPEPLGLAPEPVEVRRNGGLAAAVGVVASSVAIAYLARATAGGSWLDWVLCLAMGALGAGYLLSFVDARTPLLVADAQGVRLRLGRTWRGLPWAAIDHVEHQPRRGFLRDGRLVLIARDTDGVVADLDRSGRRQVALASRLYGAPFAVPLALSTRVIGAGEDLTGALERLAGDPDRVIEPDWRERDGYDEHADDHAADDGFEVDEPEEMHDRQEAQQHGEQHLGSHLRDPRPALARGIGYLATRLRPTAEGDEPQPVAAPSPMVASATPIPLRDLVSGARAEVRFERVAAVAAPVDDDVDATTTLPEADELRRTDDDHLDDTVAWGDRVRPIATPGDAVAPLVIDDFEVEPAPDPVVGPELAAARTRLALTVDQLAERTRIRPHVIESIEVDDFAPCGGDFYARGHLRTLARVLGVDAAPLLASYDQRYADAPIDARRVFEAELATGVDGPIRSTRGGPNWSVLVAAVMAVVLAWSIARLITDSPIELHHKPVLNGSPSSATNLGPPVPVVLDASSGGAHVVVRDGAGEVVFTGDLAYGDSKTLKAAPPVRVQSSDGALLITVDGEDRGPLGADGQPAQNTFAAAD